MKSGAHRGSRAVVLAVTAALTIAAAVSGLAPTAGAGTSGGQPSFVLDEDMRGEAAIRALGDRLPVAAARNDLSPAAFRAAIRKDSMVWVGRTGRLLFVDEFGHDDHDHAETSGSLESTATTLPTDVFDLHSLPGAQRTIVLDFNGHDARGTAWGNTEAQNTAPYSIDGDPATFNDDEKAVIHSVWQRVAEDYAPFAVNVTTKDPAHGPGSRGADIIRRDDLSDTVFGTRVVVTPSKPYNCNCGGVAYVGVFDETGATHDYYQPAWVFTAGVGNGAKNIAEAASHEAGHNLGLNHDGTKRSGYYSGHEDWAPIMGVGYNKPITQWSRGEYSGANNKEDDFGVIWANGAPAAADEFGGTTGTAGVLSGSISGVIGSRTDVDLFSFTPTLTGVATISADPAPTSPNLDIRLRLLGTDGTTVLASADPASSASTGSDTTLGLDADLVANVVAGTTYFVEVDGVGFGDPATTGYSDYASVGRFTLSASVAEGTVTEPEDPVVEDQTPAAPSNATASGSPTVTVAWTDNSTNEDGFEVWREKKVRGRWGSATKVAATAANATSATDSPGKGTFRYRVRAFDGTLFSGWSNDTAEVATASK